MATGPRYRIGARGTPAFPFRRGRGFAPTVHLPGATGAHTAALKRAQGAPTPEPIPDPTPQAKCIADYIVKKGVDGVGQLLINIQQAARRPSYIDPPLASTKIERHVGTGNVVSGDPPILIGIGGLPILVLDYTVPSLYRGVINYWGVDVVEGPAAAADLRWRIILNGRRVSPFDALHGPFAAGAGGDWAGPPFALENPNRNLCVHLKGGDVVQLQALNFNAALARNVRAIMGGWEYQPTVFEPGLTVRATMTDQQ